VLIGKVGLDGHDRGAKAVAFALRDAGFEVTYTGLRQTPEMIVAVAIEEDVDAIGISLLSGAHLEVMERLCTLLRDEGMAHDTVVMLGGNVPSRDHPALRAMGVDGIFPTSSRFENIAAWLRQAVSERRNKEVAQR
jgi:methylmalonyl-CoA mutase, C-terminal domain